MHTNSATFDFDAIALTETWLNSSVSDNEIFVLIFTYRTDRPSFAGCVLIVVNNHFSSKLFPIANDAGIEFVAVKVRIDSAFIFFDLFIYYSNV